MFLYIHTWYAMICLIFFYRLNDEPAHFKIKQKRDYGQLKFAVYEKWFDNLNNLIDFYKENPMEVIRGVTHVTVQLTVPIPKAP